MLLSVLASAAMHALLAAAALCTDDGTSLAQAQRRGAEASSSVMVRSITVTSSNDATSAPTPSEPRPPVPSASVHAPETVPEPVARTARRHFEVSEVDSPAMPVPDWQLDAESLLSRGVRKLSFEILISADGEGERCRILAVEGFSSIASDAVAAQLCSTRLSPAVKAGVAVPSVRRIELFLSR